MGFKVLGEISNVEMIAKGTGIRERKRLAKAYAEAPGEDGAIQKAELHWYEAHGIGKKEFKIKRFVG